MAAALGLPVTAYHNTLNMVARRLDGGRKEFFRLVALAAAHGDDACRKFLLIFSELPAREQGRCNIDEVCMAAGVSPLALLTTAAAIGYQADVEISGLFRAIAHPEVVRRTIESAKRIDGDFASVAQKDREWLHQSAGFIPVPRNNVINIGVNASASASAESAPQGSSVPSFLVDVQATEGPRATVQRQLIGDGSSGAPEDTIEWPA